jgi:hypothetical protein
VSTKKSSAEEVIPKMGLEGRMGDGQQAEEERSFQRGQPQMETCRSVRKLPMFEDLYVVSLAYGMQRGKSLTLKVERLLWASSEGLRI